MASEFPNIEARLGLHQSVRVIYVVDGYEVTLYGDDDETVVIAEASAPSIAEALDALDAAIGQ